MKTCTIARITSMLPNGVVTGVRVLGTGLVPDSYEFGMKQWPTIAASPVTGKVITVYELEMHAEGTDPVIFHPDTEGLSQEDHYRLHHIPDSDPGLD